jgi:hypothetical protein
MQACFAWLWGLSVALAGGERASVDTPASVALRPFFALEFRPLSRLDLVWVDEGRTSGTTVGEFDGAVRPSMGAMGGLWVNRWFGFSVGLGVAQRSTISLVDDVEVRQHTAVIRPSLDVRLGWARPQLRRPTPWVLLGVYGDVPSVGHRSDAYSEDEQAAADATSETERIRLGGVGGRVGFGVDYRVLPGLSIGAMTSLGLHRSAYQGADSSVATMWLATDASLLLMFEWPPRGERGGGHRGQHGRPSQGAGTEEVAPLRGEEAPLALPVDDGGEGQPAVADRKSPEDSPAVDTSEAPVDP